MHAENDDTRLHHQKIDEREIAEQWVAGGTLPDADETWNTPIEDPDATMPLRR